MAAAVIILHTMSEMIIASRQFKEYRRYDFVLIRFGSVFIKTLYQHLAIRISLGNGLQFANLKSEIVADLIL